MYKRAKALLTCMVPEYEGGGCTPRREQGSRAFLERKSRSIPSTPAVSWQGSFPLGAKIEHCQLNFRPFDIVFSGIGRV